jgi:hypothetical protein
VRREEVSTRPELTHTRWLWLKNWTNLSAPQRRDLHRLMRPSPTLNAITTTRPQRNPPRSSTPADHHAK